MVTRTGEKKQSEYGAELFRQIVLGALCVSFVFFVLLFLEHKEHEGYTKDTMEKMINKMKILILLFAFALSSASLFAQDSILKNWFTPIEQPDKNFLNKEQPKPFPAPAINNLT